MNWSLTHDIQKKINKLTCGYLNELIDEECCQAATADLVTPKAALTRNNSDFT